MKLTNSKRIPNVRGKNIKISTKYHPIKTNIMTTDKMYNKVQV